MTASPLYVRSAMLDPEKPPASQSGAVRWVRENLISSWFNVILTIASLYAVFLLVSAIGPWLARSVWNAGSLDECRAILLESYGPDAKGACFAVIRERWQQLLFGFYPRDLYWRPILAFVLLLVALSPVLFAAVPRKVLWFSLIYPATAFWLLWGGTVWQPVAVMAGLALVAWVGARLSRQAGMLTGTVYGIALFLCVFLDPLSMIANALEGILSLLAGSLVVIPTTVFGFDLRDLFPLLPHVVALMQDMLPISLRALQSDDMGGFMLSGIIGVSGIAFSLPLGVLLALGRQSDMLLVKSVCVGFIEVLRGVPLITLLLTAFYLLNYFLPPGTSFDIILRVIIMVTLFASAYMAEVIRGGLAALPRGQYEAADALGMDYWQAQRYIIMPQALKISIPGIVNNFIGLFKDTTLVLFIGLLDPLGLVKSIRADTNWNGVYWELFIFVGGLFFIVCFSMSRYSMYLERKLKTDHR